MSFSGLLDMLNFLKIELLPLEKNVYKPKEVFKKSIIIIKLNFNN